ncbi:class I SAM-dependent methyltransferase [Bacillus sp. FJAT-45350]|uniref:class I SAM-dependent methyltransferase n=1 Tax=Bacillus sp. FJAT-45350 TaxID=2011014 RepID=UPI000BB8286B|nr:class I SAM-dependent methyltransferase [Bacillus sp. FJAT-45350]
MLSEWKRLLKARKWMKKNEPFLPTWHAYIGFTMHLFEYFSRGDKPEDVAKEHGLAPLLLQRWVEVGLAIGHLKKKRAGKIKATKEMLTYFTASSPKEVGSLVKEMLELHIPTLLSCQNLLKEPEQTSYENNSYSGMVAETSTILEKLIFPKIHRLIKKNNITSVMDLGCGYGGYLQRLYRKSPNMDLIGIEADAHVAEKAKERLSNCNVEVLKGDIRDMEVEEYQVELVLVNNLIYYFSLSDRHLLFEKMAQVIDESGYVIVTTPINKSKGRNAFSAAFNSFMSAHKNMFPLPTEKELISMAEKQGFHLRKRWSAIPEGGWYSYAFQK